MIRHYKYKLSAFRLIDASRLVLNSCSKIVGGKNEV
jgi:hypothetical protein